MTPIKFIKAPAVEDLRGCKNSKLFSDVRRGLLTPPIRRSAKDAVWPLHEIAAINAADFAGKTRDEVKVLVKQLVAARAKAETHAD